MVCLNDLNDNHYRIGLSTIIFIIYKKTIFAYTCINSLDATKMEKPIIQVAIALLFHKNQILVGWREAKQHQGNKYEFPGGKVEQGESAEQACRREIQEEVGIIIDQWYLFDFIQHDYDDVIVQLHIFHAHVEHHQLAAISKPWTWYQREQLSELNFPKANDTIIQRLQWSHYIKISEHLCDLSLLQSDHLLYLRTEPNLTLIEAIHQLSVKQKATLILNFDFWSKLNAQTQLNIAAVHLKNSQLQALYQAKLERSQSKIRTDQNLLIQNQQSVLHLPQGIACIAACHDAQSLHWASQLGCEAVLLSPVLDTESHPDRQGMGWEKFQDLAKMSHMPVFALGGLKPDDLTIAQQRGAYGVAGIRNF